MAKSHKDLETADIQPDTVSHTLRHGPYKTLLRFQSLVHIMVTNNDVTR